MALNTPYTHVDPLEYSDETGWMQNQHLVIKDGMGGLVLAPIDIKASPLRILDSGTADGTWIQDLAASAAPTVHNIYGIDINPAYFPTDVPAGTVYQVQDVNEPWPEDWEGQFDFVHQRLVFVGAGPEAKEVTLSLCRLVKPGGWIQLIELTNQVAEGSGPSMHAFVGLMNDIFTHMGADLDLAQHLPEWLKEAGFVDVNFIDFGIKLCAASPDAELTYRGVVLTGIDVRDLIQSENDPSPGTLSLSAEILDSLPNDVEEELKEKGALYPLRCVWARKPL